MVQKVRKLQGIAREIEKKDEFVLDEDGNKWRKCIFVVELTGFSKRTPNEIIPEEIKGNKIKLIRYCCFDWHYKIDSRKTLESDETEAVLSGRKTETVYW